MVRVFSDRYVLAEHQSFSKVIPLCTHALCIEAGHQKLFYSGDFRAHGRKGALCEALTDNPPTSITTLLMEGSSIGRIPDYGHYPTEDDIEQQLAKQFTAADGLGLVHTSSQNIDRVVSILRAAQRTGRTLIIDLYTAAILAATENPKIPQSHWEQVRLYVPQSQRVQIKRKGWFAQLQQHASNRIYREDLVDMAATAVLLFRPLHMRDLTQADCLQGAVYIFSQWEGYWKRGDYAHVDTWLQKHGIPKRSIHTSGHASTSDLKRLVTALQPDKVVPIHSFESKRYPELFPNVVQHADGDWWEV